MPRSRRLHPFLILIFTLFLLTASLTSCAGADLSATDCSDGNFYVNSYEDISDGACNDENCTLRDAVEAANTCRELPDYTIWLPPGDYVLSLRGPGDGRGDLDLKRSVTIVGAALRFTSESPDGSRETGYGTAEDPYLSTILGTSSWNDRIFEVHPGVVADIQWLNIIGGNSSLDGGAILNYGDLTFLHSVLAANISATYGGGIANFGELDIEDVELNDNFASRSYGCGGGIYNEGDLSIIGANIHNNQAKNGSGVCSREGTAFIGDTDIHQNGHRSIGIGGLGGGVSATGTAISIENSRITDNRARTGGGIYVTLGALDMDGSTLSANQAANGGGLFAGATSSIDVDGTLFEGNHAYQLEGRDGTLLDGEGGGVNITTSNYDFYQSPMLENSADRRGGGMYINYGVPGRGFFSHAAIANNSTAFGHGAGVYVHRGEILLANATLSSNEGPENGVAFYNGAGSNSAFVYVTMSHNTARTGTGAIPAIFNEVGGQLSFDSSILMGISRTVACNGDRSGLRSEGYNIIGALSACNLRATSDRSFISGIESLLGPLLDMDGTLAHPPIPGGLAVDYIPERDCVRDDQRLAERPAGTLCDVGAIELDVSELSLEGELPESDPIATALTNASCRVGADTQFAVHNFLFEGENAQVIGRMTEGTWLYVELPNDFGRCWIFGQNLDLTGPIDSLPFYTPPELPTADDGGGDDSSDDGGGGNNQGGGSVPDGPSNVSAQCNGGGFDFTITWNDNSDNEDGFRILRDGQEVGTVGANVEQYVHDPAGSGPYSITIEAYNGTGIGKATLGGVGCLP